MQLHLWLAPFFLGSFSECICSFQQVGNHLFYAAAISGFFGGGEGISASKFLGCPFWRQCRHVEARLIETRVGEGRARARRGEDRARNGRGRVRTGESKGVRGRGRETLGVFGGHESVIRPQNPRTTPTKSTINIAGAKLVVVRSVPFSYLGSDKATNHPPSPKIPLDEKGL